MKKNGRLVCINGTNVTITGMDYDYADVKDILSETKFNITFNVSVNNKIFVLNFTNEIVSNQNNYSDTFIGNSDSFKSFLIEVENNSQLKENNLFSDDTQNAANEVIGAIAQSVYSHVKSHSPDQDEE